MGVIQSGLNQSLITTAALVSQSPAFQEAQKEKIVKREEKEFMKKDLPSATKALAGIGDPKKKSVKELSQDMGKYDYINKTFQKAQDIAMKRKDPGMYSQAYALSDLSQKQMNTSRELREQLLKKAEQKVQDQTDQMNEIKQHTKYSDEDDLDNPYYYMGW